jgi:hypothetical protein
MVTVLFDGLSASAVFADCWPFAPAVQPICAAMNPRSKRENLRAPEFLKVEKEHGSAKKVARAVTDEIIV